MTHAQILKLERTGHLSSFLRDTWRIRTGEDPIKISREIRRFEIWGGFLKHFAGWLIGLAFFGVLSGAFGVAEAAMCLIGCLVANVLGGIPSYPNKTRMFELYYGELLNLMHYAPETIATFNREKLREVAEEILVKKALEVLRAEKAAIGNELTDDWEWYKLEEEHAAEKQEFQWAHQVFRNLGLVGGSYHKYFRKAEAESAV